MSDPKKKRPRDANQLAKRIAEIATGEVDETKTPEAEKARRTGAAGGQARAEALSPSRRAEIAREGARARWEDQ